MRPEIDRARFARAVSEALGRAGLSTRAAGALPGLNPAMVSRATSEHVLSAASMLALCHVLGLDPFAFLIAPPVSPLQSNQTVTAIVSRETGGARQ